MELSFFDYPVPKDLIAQEPLPQRDASRMMVIDRKTQTITHSRFQKFPGYLEPEDLLILNNSKVLPLRLLSPDNECECLLLEDLGEGVWRCLVKPGKKFKQGKRVVLHREVSALVESEEDAGAHRLRFETVRPLRELLPKIGVPPTPPYIQRKPLDPRAQSDRERYQTVYAKHVGSAAAPTAGFHFTQEILDKLKTQCHIAFVTLHVGIDTFRPVKVQNIEGHTMHGEFYEIPPETIKAIENRKGRVICCGTTSVRALESAFSENTVSVKGVTTKFIRPGYQFRLVDGLLTNFHQPKSTLLMLISALAGREFILKAYEEAIAEKYRLFSYGDCMLIL